MIARAFAVLALAGFAIGLCGEIAQDITWARLGEAAFLIFGFSAWILAMCRVWKKRAERLAPKSREHVPLTTALAQAAALSIERARRKGR